jgi:AcrR family transcriptional regulator
MTEPSTKERILDAAEALYAEFGFAETSMRALTARAGVNLAAVHYHFGSKEGLFRALVERRFSPINEERLARLDSLEAQGDPTLEQILEALVAPIVQLRFDDPGAASQLVQIIGRLTSAKSFDVEDFGDVFRETSERFFPALRRALSGLGPEETLWRFNCTLGVMIGTLLDPHGFLRAPEIAADAGYRRRVLAQIVAFLAGGLRAEASSPSEESSAS